MDYIPPASVADDGWEESEWGLGLLIGVPLLVLVLVLVLYVVVWKQKERKKLEDKKKSIMRGVSLSYLLVGLQADAHEAVQIGIRDDTLHEYNDENRDVFHKKLLEKQAARVEAALGNLDAARNEAGKWSLVRVAQEVDKAEDKQKQLKQQVTDHEAAAKSTHDAKERLIGASTVDTESAAEAQAAVATAEAEQKQLRDKLCSDSNFVQKLKVEYDPNFYQIKVALLPSLLCSNCA